MGLPLGPAVVLIAFLCRITTPLARKGMDAFVTAKRIVVRQKGKTMQLAKEAYEAYANHTGWKSLATGQPLPQWDSLPRAIQEAWEVSAAWVAGKVSGMHDWKTPKSETLKRWLEGEFREACQNDRKRLTESLWMIKVGKDQGDAPEAIMGRAIASFVKGLILGEQPITVPTENN